MKKVIIIVCVIAIIAAALLLAWPKAAAGIQELKANIERNREAVRAEAEKRELEEAGYSRAQDEINGKAVPVLVEGKVFFLSEPEEEDLRFFYDALKAESAFESNPKFTAGEAIVKINCADAAKISEGLQEETDALLKEAAANAEKVSDVYDENYEYLPELLEDIRTEALKLRLEDAEDCSAAAEIRETLEYDEEKKLFVVTAPEIGEISTEELKERILLPLGENEKYLVTYKIEESATKGERPDESLFGESYDPADLAAVLATPRAQYLMAGRELCWNENIDFLENSKIRWYLDDSILMIQWQELAAQTVGTFCEIIVTDGSQIRHKIAEDTFGSYAFKYPTEYALDTNSVLTVGGDMYNSGRGNGNVVYGRTVYRYDFWSCDNCYIDSNGDMKFSYRWQFETEEEVNRFVEENDIVFSLCFGPVLIDNGVDKTPDSYTWGEINEGYARAALGQLGEHHYITMNMNCRMPDHYYYATLRQAADEMIKRGCINAYALDGGQTAITVVQGEFINPVQFGWEKLTSDVLYFASAVPENCE